MRIYPARDWLRKRFCFVLLMSSQIFNCHFEDVFFHCMMQNLVKKYSRKYYQHLDKTTTS